MKIKSKYPLVTFCSLISRAKYEIFVNKAGHVFITKFGGLSGVYCGECVYMDAHATKYLNLDQIIEKVCDRLASDTLVPLKFEIY